MVLLGPDQLTNKTLLLYFLYFYINFFAYSFPFYSSLKKTLNCHPRNSTQSTQIMEENHQYSSKIIVTRPGVAGALLQTPL